MQEFDEILKSKGFSEEQADQFDEMNLTTEQVKTMKTEELSKLLKKPDDKPQALDENSNVLKNV